MNDDEKHRWELAQKFEAFVVISDDTLRDPSFLDLLTQVIDLRLNAEKVQGEFGVYRQNVYNHITEILNFRTTTTQQLEGLQKKNLGRDRCILSGCGYVEFKSC